MESAPTTSYVKLTGVAVTSGLITSVRSTLWQGPDHLLYVTHEGYMESYKRFYFRDIQAFVLRRTRKQPVYGTVYALLLLLFGVPGVAGFFAGWHWAIGGSLLLLAGLSLLGFVLNWRRGPTASLYLRTAVHTVRILSVTRLGPALDLLRHLEPLVEGAQPLLTGDDEARVLREWEERVQARPATPAPAPPRPEPAPTTESGRVQEASFALLIVEAVLGLCRFFGEDIVWSLMGLAFLVWSAQLVFMIIGLVRMRNSTIPAIVRTLSWSALALVVASVLVTVLYYVFRLVSVASQNHPAWDTVAEDTPFIRAERLVRALMAAAIGVVGLIETFRYRRSRRVVAPPVPRGKEAP